MKRTSACWAGRTQVGTIDSISVRAAAEAMRAAFSWNTRGGGRVSKGGRNPVRVSLADVNAATQHHPEEILRPSIP
jgi:hypothetical protein